MIVFGFVGIVVGGFLALVLLTLRSAAKVASDADDIAEEQAQRSRERRAIRDRRERRVRPSYFEKRADELGSEAEAFLAGRPR